MPLRVAMTASGTGMPQTRMANKTAARVAKKAACCPLDRLMPSIYNRINSGMAATRADRPRLPKGI